MGTGREGRGKEGRGGKGRKGSPPHFYNEVYATGSSRLRRFTFFGVILPEQLPHIQLGLGLVLELDSGIGLGLGLGPGLGFMWCGAKTEKSLNQQNKKSQVIIYSFIPNRIAKNAPLKSNSRSRTGFVYWAACSINSTVNFTIVTRK